MLTYFFLSFVLRQCDSPADLLCPTARGHCGAVCVPRRRSHQELPHHFGEQGLYGTTRGHIHRYVQLWARLQLYISGANSHSPPNCFYPYIFFFLYFVPGRESKAQELLALPWTNINAQYANGNTPLILAIQGREKRRKKQQQDILFYVNKFFLLLFCFH